MRPIKFRFWSGTKMFYDLENVMECLKQQMAFNEGLKLPIPYDHVGLHGAAFLQLTGLVDTTTGKDIYAGDIISVRYASRNYETGDSELTSPAIGVVDWNEHSTGWVVRCKSPMSVSEDGTVMTSIICDGGEREVLGNIHENPERLNDKS
jgi:uncharacterized phage protein (TIGR01671 family)